MQFSPGYIFEKNSGILPGNNRHRCPLRDTFFGKINSVKIVI